MRYIDLKKQNNELKNELNIRIGALKACEITARNLDSLVIKKDAKILELEKELAQKNLELQALERVLAERDNTNKTLSEALLKETNKNADLECLLEARSGLFGWIKRWFRYDK